MCVSGKFNFCDKSLENDLKKVYTHTHTYAEAYTARDMCYFVAQKFFGMNERTDGWSNEKKGKK